MVVLNLHYAYPNMAHASSFIFLPSKTPSSIFRKHGIYMSWYIHVKNLVYTCHYTLTFKPTSVIITALSKHFRQWNHYGACWILWDQQTLSDLYNALHPWEQLINSPLLLLDEVGEKVIAYANDLTTAIRGIFRVH